MCIFAVSTGEDLVLINNTPTTRLEGDGTASIQVDFTLPSDAASATCQLIDATEPLNCKESPAAVSQGALITVVWVESNRYIIVR